MEYEVYTLDSDSSKKIDMNGCNFEIKCEKIKSGLSSLKNALYWNLITLGKGRVYTVYDNQNLIHFSYVIKGNWKFTFLKHKDIEIGPCWTHPDYRGRNIYPAVLYQIVKKVDRGGMHIC